jgi:hypothetical protein
MQKLCCFIQTNLTSSFSSFTTPIDLIYNEDYSLINYILGHFGAKSQLSKIKSHRLLFHQIIIIVI